VEDWAQNLHNSKHLTSNDHKNAHGEQVIKMHNFAIKEMHQLQYACVKWDEVSEPREQ